MRCSSRAGGLASGVPAAQAPAKWRPFLHAACLTSLAACRSRPGSQREVWPGLRQRGFEHGPCSTQTACLTRLPLATYNMYVQHVQTRINLCAAAERYDHHQRGFEEVFGHGFSTKLSSAGGWVPPLRFTLVGGTVSPCRGRPSGWREVRPCAPPVVALLRHVGCSPHAARATAAPTPPDASRLLLPPLLRCVAGLVYKHYGREIVGSAMGLPGRHSMTWGRPAGGAHGGQQLRGDCSMPGRRARKRGGGVNEGRSSDFQTFLKAASLFFKPASCCVCRRPPRRGGRLSGGRL